jgi:hypothetical protein
MCEFPEKFGEHCCFCLPCISLRRQSLGPISEVSTRRRKFLPAALLAFLVFSSIPAVRAANSPALISAPAAPKKVIIDTDPGTDDAIAIMLALTSPELDVRALTVVPGNVDARQGLENALKLASFCFL